MSERKDSLDEIAEAMLVNETEDGTWIDTATARQIIAALRAGQALRDWPCTPDKSWEEVSKAWDAAVGEGE